MIPREKAWILFTTCTFLLIVEVKLQSGRSYDTNDWIPVTPTSAKVTTSKDVEQTASDRVLSLDVPAQKFFPDEEYEYRNRRPNQVQQFLRESPTKKGVEQPRPRKLKHQLEYKFETPPPPPLKNQPQINYYNGQNMSPYIFEQPTLPRVSKPVTQQTQQSYYVPVQQVPNQRPTINSYVAVPSINPQVPAPNAPNLYEQYQLPFNSSFYQSLNPTSLNNEFYQVISNNTQNVQKKLVTNIPQPSIPIINRATVSPKPVLEKESVQLVYVPVENLKTNQSPTQATKNVYQVDIPQQETIAPQSGQISNFKFLDQPRQEALVYNPPYLQQQQPELIYQQVDDPRQEKLLSLQDSTENKQQRLENIQQDFIQQALQAHKLQQQLQDDINPLKQEFFTTTPKPNRKPHQPPLAVFMESQKKAEISDVLNILKDASSISVQDIVTPNSPKIFVGPSNLDSPEGYTKFPLPYLNNINGNRIERKIDQLPFFVAPVSYKTPPGYSKIPLPSPHVGSVVVSVPLMTPTTAEPYLLTQNQLNPFTFSTAGYSPLDPPTPSRPVQNYLNNYESPDQGRIRYQSTPAPEATESPLIPPVRDIFDSQFSPPQPDVYYTQQDNQQTYRDNVPNLDIYRPQLQENNRYVSSQENTRQNPSTVRPKDNSYEISQLPNVNPLELAINEFELHQINSQFEQPNKKVKHSTTRRPQSKTNYEDNQTVSSTRTPVSRGRHTYETEAPAERTTARSRVRGRGRGSSSRTVPTTTTTTPVPIENERYTILEKFVAKEPSRDSDTDVYGRFSAEAETKAPRRSTTPSNRNVYLPEQSSEVKRPQSELEYRRSQRPLDNSFENTQSNSNLENSRSQALLDDGFQTRLPQIELKTSNPQTLIDDTRPQTQLDSIQSQVDELETPDVKRVTLTSQKPQTAQQPNQYYQSNTEIENIPASVYSLGQPQTYDSTAFDFDSSKNVQDPIRLLYENVQRNENINIDVTPRPSQEPTRSTHSHRFSPEVVSYENREPNQQLRPKTRTKYQEYDDNVNNEPVVKQAFQSETYQRPSSEITDQELVEQKPKQQSVNDPSEFLENLYQPNFDQTYLSLQDQAVRSLLVPNLLAPSTKQLPSIPNNEDIPSSTEAIVELPSSTEAETTTTTRATKTRGRGRARPATTSASVTSASRRRRPVSRTSTERIASTTEYSSREDTERSSSNSKQNFRTRSRPVQKEISDRISTTENDIRAFNVPTLEGGFEAINNRESPQSYMQFEHAIDEQQIITINPDLNQETEVKEYHQVYSLPSQSTTERQQFILDYENTRPRPTPVVDVQVTHAQEEYQRVPEGNQRIPEGNPRNSDVITKPTEIDQYVRYSNANIRSGGVLNNNKPVTTTKIPTTKTRTRTRGRSRVASTTKAPSRPVTRISTSSPLRTTTPEIEEQESYGFIRQPAYSQKNIQAQKPLQTISRIEEPAVRFVGEIRPKYSPRKTSLPPADELESAETPRPKIRTRTKAPARKVTNTYRQLDNDVNSSKNGEQVTRRTGTTRGRVRGSTHFKSPDYQKRESDDEDVANQNYPVNFLQKLDASSTPTTGAFQITIDPLDEDVDDQSPHSSIYRPKFLAKPDGWSDPNSLPIEDKPVSVKLEEILSSELPEDIFSTEEPQALPIVQTTENSDDPFTHFTNAEVDNIMMNLEKIQTSPTEEIPTILEPTEKMTEKTARRRGAWKLVRQRPVDPLEVSESQNYQSVVNVFNSINKVDPYAKTQHRFNTGKNSNDKEIVNYSNFKQEINSFSDDHSENQNFDDTKDVEEIVTVVSENDSVNTEHVTETNDEFLTTNSSNLKTQENIFDTIYEMFGIFNKPGDKKNETIVTSSESSDKEVPTTTIVNPVFPEEITEEAITATSEKIGEIKQKEEENADDRKESTERISTTTSEVKPLTKPYEVEPWEMRAVKTSTSTEVSHETEICYKGRCVKSKEKKKYK